MTTDLSQRHDHLATRCATRPPARQDSPSESAEDGEVVPFARTHPTTRTARGKEDAS